MESPLICSTLTTSWVHLKFTILDFFIVIMSLIGLFINGFQVVKVIRIFRVLRPLKLISKSESLKMSINAIINSIPSIFNLAVLMFLFYLMAGILGINFFKGKPLL